MQYCRYFFRNHLRPIRRLYGVYFLSKSAKSIFKILLVLAFRQVVLLHSLLGDCAAPQPAEDSFFNICLYLPGLYSRYSLIQRFQRLPDLVQILLVFILPSFPELQRLINMPSLAWYSLVGVVLPSLPLYSLVGVAGLLLPLGLVIIKFLLSQTRL